MTSPPWAPGHAQARRHGPAASTRSPDQPLELRRSGQVTAHRPGRSAATRFPSRATSGPAFQIHRPDLRRDPPRGRGHRPARPTASTPLGRSGTRRLRLARHEHDRHPAPTPARPAPPDPRLARLAPLDQPRSRKTRGSSQRRRLTFHAKEPGPHHLHRSWGAIGRLRGFGWSLVPDELPVGARLLADTHASCHFSSERLEA